MLNVEQMQKDTEKAEQQIRLQKAREAEAAANLKELQVKELKSHIVDAINKNIKQGKWFLLYDVPHGLCYEIMKEFPELKPKEEGKAKETVRIRFTWERG